MGLIENLESGKCCDEVLLQAELLNELKEVKESGNYYLLNEEPFLQLSDEAKNDEKSVDLFNTIKDSILESVACDMQNQIMRDRLDNFDTKSIPYISEDVLNYTGTDSFGRRSNMRIELPYNMELTRDYLKNVNNGISIPSNNFHLKVTIEGELDPIRYEVVDFTKENLLALLKDNEYALNRCGCKDVINKGYQGLGWYEKDFKEANITPKETNFKRNIEELNEIPKENQPFTEYMLKEIDEINKGKYDPLKDYNYNIDRNKYEQPATIFYKEAVSMIDKLNRYDLMKEEHKDLDAKSFSHLDKETIHSYKNEIERTEIALQSKPIENIDITDRIAPNKVIEQNNENKVPSKKIIKEGRDDI